MTIRKVFEQIAVAQDLKLKQMEKLNYLMEEFAETTNDLFLWVIDYCDKNNIPIWKEEIFKNRVEASKRILREIHNSSIILKNCCKQISSDEFLQDDGTDEDLTEPIFISSNPYFQNYFIQ